MDERERKRAQKKEEIRTNGRGRRGKTEVKEGDLRRKEVREAGRDRERS